MHELKNSFPILWEFLQEVKYSIILLWHWKMLRHEDWQNTFSFVYCELEWRIKAIFSEVKWQNKPFPQCYRPEGCSQFPEAGSFHLRISVLLKRFYFPSQTRLSYLFLPQSYCEVGNWTVWKLAITSCICMYVHPCDYANEEHSVEAVGPILIILIRVVSSSK